MVIHISEMEIIFARRGIALFHESCGYKGRDVYDLITSYIGGASF